MSDKQKDNETPVVRYESGIPILDVRLSEMERRQSEAESRDQRYKDAQIALNRRLVYATVALVGATVFMGVIAGIQLGYIHRQWKLTSDGLSKMGDQIWAAKDAAYASQKASGTAAQALTNSETSFDKTLRQMQQQTEVARKSNRITRESLVSVQRAFLICQDIVPLRETMRDESGKYNVWNFTMPCENRGTTPANVTSQSFYYAKLPNAPTEDQFLEPPSTQNILVGPKDIHNVGDARLKESWFFGHDLPDMPADVVSELKSKGLVKISGAYVFWGWVSYRDTFPDTDVHLTEFCRGLIGINIDRANPNNLFRFGWKPCDQHNCADRYCDDYQKVMQLIPKTR